MSNRIADIGMEKTVATKSAEAGKKSTGQQNANHEKIAKGYGAAGKRGACFRHMGNGGNVKRLRTEFPYLQGSGNLVSLL